MTNVLILTFFGTALAVGLYCLWVSLRVEFARVPRFLQMDGGDTLHPAMSGTNSTLAGRPAQNTR